MLKTLTFAVLHFTVAFGVAYVLTGSVSISSGVALIEPLVNTIAFYFHDKAWKHYENKSEKSEKSDDYFEGGHRSILSVWQK